MRILFFLVVVLACAMLMAAVVFIDSGIVRDSMICALGALTGFLLAYQMQARFSILAD